MCIRGKTRCKGVLMVANYSPAIFTRGGVDNSLNKAEQCEASSFSLSLSFSMHHSVHPLWVS